MNENPTAARDTGKAAHKGAEGEILPPGKDFTIDCAKMKRWHGAPPLMLGQSETEFQDFIASFATCVDRGDAMTESLVYSYGLERYRMGQLLAQRGKLSLAYHQFFVEFERRNEERRKHRQNKKEEGPEISDSIKTAPPQAVENTLIMEDITDIRRNMHYKPQHKLDEMTAAVEFEATIDRYGRVEVLIDNCEARANALLLQISLHDVQVAQRLKAKASEFITEYLDALLDEQEKERQAFALGSSADISGNAKN